MFDIKNFIRTCESAVAQDDLPAIVAAVQGAIDDPEQLAAALPPFDGDETLLHSSESLAVVHLRMTPNAHYPPHNHHMPLVVGIYKGTEFNQGYSLEGGKLKKGASQRYSAGRVLVLESNAIHSVANPGEDYSYGLHVYAGDLVHQERSIWDPNSLATHPYSDERYFGFCQAFDPRKPFERPTVCYAHEAQR